ncbi:uncharacterized protein A4U43_C07F5770 [Asparagus officinalis]|uniref:Protein kinase domain-containing protein n=1 Tax=Asparagus officinalis TaxID=4686 RepID=A0A5P1E9S0_ASPOF|nr:protein MALE DISCOVERER 1-like [Asparagus officinalis]ONK62598.1 uncharacterized protein A4U43_C07F5770 [Asparagus officinalis]
MRRFKLLKALILLMLLDLCASIDDEGRALLRFRERVELDPYGALLNWDREAQDPCFWFGVECLNEKVVSLNLGGLHLKGKLTPELGKLIHMKSLILRNNSFSGVIPRELEELRKLEVLDLGHNNLSGPVPPDLGNILCLKILVLRGNSFISNIPQELKNLNVFSELQMHEELLCSARRCGARDVGSRTNRRLLQVGGEDRVWHHKNVNNNIKPQASTATAVSPSPMMTLDTEFAPSFSPSLSPFHPPAVSPSSMEFSPLSSPSPSIDFPTPVPSLSPAIEPPSPVAEPKLHTKPPSSFASTPTSHSNPPSVSLATEEKSTAAWKIYVPVVAGVSILVTLSVVCFLCCRANRVVTVRPWATGLSGQLQKAFVTGVPSLKRSELEAACEDFSNIIGSLSDCMLYKGTLSSGVEIAVVSTVVTSAKNWSKQSESQFRKKISELSKVNHKNFVNLLGYCAEQEPFTRMLVFEYAPNGSLFEHLHVKEAEDLDWAARLRIAMGIAYCLDYMHQLNPPVILKTLNSSTIYLTDDYASKVGDIGLWNETKETESPSIDDSLLSRESIVYKFGILMLEILSGRVPFSSENDLQEPWFSCYLNGDASVKDLIDPAIGSYREEDVTALFDVIRSCINPDPDCRPAMAEVAAKLKVITSMSPDGATPKVSPLWWAEIEILSSEAN